MAMKNYLICAIDTSDFDIGYMMIKELSPYVGGIKLGLEFFAKYGINGVEKFSTLGVPIFLDLKLHDIPNTVYKTCLVLRDLDIELFTVHVAGGLEMLQSALSAFNGKNTKIIGVTRLTSLSADNEIVIMNSRIAKNAGLHGVVCAGNAINIIRNEFQDDFLIVTPGIRVLQNLTNDHVEVISPKKALGLGANYLVIGRPITEAKDPILAVKNIFNECNS